MLASGVPLHAIAGLGGWLTLTAMGVSYRLLSMFMLAPDVDDRKSNTTLLAGALATTVAVAGGVAAITLSFGMNVALSFAAIFGLVTAALYGRDVIAIFRERRRRQLELNTRMAMLSFASLGGTALLGVMLVLTGNFATHVGAFVFLVVFGWLSGLVLAKLYKIVAFLTWLETYGPVMGRSPTPRVQDLVAERRASKWFVIYYAAVWAGTLMLLADQPSAFRVAGNGDGDRDHRYRPRSGPDASACRCRGSFAASGRRPRAPSTVCEKLSAKRKERTWLEYIDVDVRPILRAGGEPFSVIMAALDRLGPGQGIRLYATFKPIPLFGVMADKGFAHSATALDDGEWEVLFTPALPMLADVPAGAPAFENWPEPAVKLDNRDLDPPEPMVRILAAAEKLNLGIRCPRFYDESRCFCSRSLKSAAFAGSAASRRTGQPMN